MQNNRLSGRNIFFACALGLFVACSGVTYAQSGIDGLNDMGQEAGGGPDQDECVPWKKAIDDLRAKGEHRAAAQLEKSPPKCTEKGGSKGVVQGICQLDKTCKAKTASDISGKQQGVDDSAKKANEDYWRQVAKEMEEMHKGIQDTLYDAVRSSPTGEMWGLNESILDQIYGGGFDGGIGSDFDSGFDGGAFSGLQGIAGYEGLNDMGAHPQSPDAPLQVEAPTIPKGSSIFDPKGVTNPDIADSVLGRQHESADVSGWEEYAKSLETSPNQRVDDAFKDLENDTFGSAQNPAGSSCDGWWCSAKQAWEAFKNPAGSPSEPVKIAVDENGNINPVDYYKAAREKFADSDVIGRADELRMPQKIKDQLFPEGGTADEWARFATQLCQQESSCRIAPVKPDGSLEKFSTTLPKEESYASLQFRKGQYGLKTWADVNDPGRSLDALVNVAEANKLQAYFGSIQRPNELLQHGGWFEAHVAQNISEAQTQVASTWGASSGSFSSPFNIAGANPAGVPGFSASGGSPFDFGGAYSGGFSTAGVGAPALDFGFTSQDYGAPGYDNYSSGSDLPDESSSQYTDASPVQDTFARTSEPSWLDSVRETARGWFGGSAQTEGQFALDDTGSFGGAQPLAGAAPELSIEDAFDTWAASTRSAQMPFSEDVAIAGDTPGGQQIPDSPENMAGSLPPPGQEGVWETVSRWFAPEAEAPTDAFGFTLDEEIAKQKAADELFNREGGDMYPGTTEDDRALAAQTEAEYQAALLRGERENAFANLQSRADALANAKKSAEQAYKDFRDGKITSQQLAARVGALQSASSNFGAVLEQVKSLDALSPQDLKTITSAQASVQKTVGDLSSLQKQMAGYSDFAIRTVLASNDTTANKTVSDISKSVDALRSVTSNASVVAPDVSTASIPSVPGAGFSPGSNPEMGGGAARQASLGGGPSQVFDTSGDFGTAEYSDYAAVSQSAQKYAWYDPRGWFDTSVSAQPASQFGLDDTGSFGGTQPLGADEPIRTSADAFDDMIVAGTAQPIFNEEVPSGENRALTDAEIEARIPKPDTVAFAPSDTADTKVRAAYDQKIKDARAQVAYAKDILTRSESPLAKATAETLLSDSEKRLNAIAEGYISYSSGNPNEKLAQAIQKIDTNSDEGFLSRGFSWLSETAHEDAKEIGKNIPNEIDILNPVQAAKAVWDMGAYGAAFVTGGLADSVRNSAEKLGILGFEADVNRALSRAIDPYGTEAETVLDVANIAPFAASPVRSVLTKSIDTVVESTVTTFGRSAADDVVTSAISRQAISGEVRAGTVAEPAVARGSATGDAAPSFESPSRFDFSRQEKGIADNQTSRVASLDNVPQERVAVGERNVPPVSAEPPVAPTRTPVSEPTPPVSRAAPAETTPARVTPSPEPSPVFDTRVNRWRDTETGRFVTAPETPTVPRVDNILEFPYVSRAVAEVPVTRSVTTAESPVLRNNWGWVDDTQRFEPTSLSSQSAPKNVSPVSGIGEPPPAIAQNIARNADAGIGQAAPTAPSSTKNPVQNAWDRLREAFGAKTTPEPAVPVASGRTTLADDALAAKLDAPVSSEAIPAARGTIPEGSVPEIAVPPSLAERGLVDVAELPEPWRLGSAVEPELPRIQVRATGVPQDPVTAIPDALRTGAIESATARPATLAPRNPDVGEALANPSKLGEKVALPEVSAESGYPRVNLTTKAPAEGEWVPVRLENAEGRFVGTDAQKAILNSSKTPDDTYRVAVSKADAEALAAGRTPPEFTAYPLPKEPAESPSLWSRVKSAIRGEETKVPATTSMSPDSVSWLTDPGRRLGLTIAGLFGAGYLTGGVSPDTDALSTETSRYTGSGKAPPPAPPPSAWETPPPTTGGAGKKAPEDKPATNVPGPGAESNPSPSGGGTPSPGIIGPLMEMLGKLFGQKKNQNQQAQQSSLPLQTGSASTTMQAAAVLIANPSRVPAGGISQLSWSSVGTLTCAVSFTSGATTTEIARGGSDGKVTTPALDKATEFALSCSTSGTESATAKTTVTVVSTSPGMIFVAKPATVVSGGVSELSWSTIGTKECNVLKEDDSVLVSGGKTGKTTTPQVSATTSFTLSCTPESGEGENKKAILTVKVE